MAVSTFSKAAAAGAAGGPTAVIPLTSTSGVFNADLTLGDAFSIDFTESYFDTIGLTRAGAPTYAAHAVAQNSNGGYVNITPSSNLYNSVDSVSYTAAVGDLFVVMTSQGCNSPSSTSFAPNIVNDTQWGWTELESGFYNDSSAYDAAWRVYYAFYDGTQNLATDISTYGGGNPSNSVAVVITVIRGADTTTPFGTVPTERINNSSYWTWDSITTTEDKSSILSFAFAGTSASTADPSETGGLTPYFVRFAEAANDTYDTSILGYFDSTGYASGTTLSEATNTDYQSSTYWNATYRIQVNALLSPSGVGPDGTLNITGYNSGVESKTFYLKNTNSTGQSYSLLGGTGFTTSTVASVASSANYTLKAFSFLDGAEAPSPVALKSQKTDIITATGTWTAPDDVTTVDVILVGGGGGGWGYDTVQNYMRGSGGGGGGVVKKTLSVTPGQSYPITVGAGGAAGSTVNLGFTDWFGFPGGSTSFSNLAVAGGGCGAAPSPQGGGLSQTTLPDWWSEDEIYGSSGGNTVSSSNTGQSNDWAGGGGGGAGGPALAAPLNHIMWSFYNGGNAEGASTGVLQHSFRLQQQGHAGGAADIYSATGSSAPIVGGPGTEEGYGAGGSGATESINSRYFAGARVSASGNGGKGQSLANGNNYPATSGAINTGAGGGGGGSFAGTDYPAGAGGSGVAVIKYWTVN